MGTLDDFFEALGPTDVGFFTHSTDINRGADIVGNQVGIKGTCAGPGAGDGVQGFGSGNFSGVAGFGGNVGHGQTAGTGVFGLGGTAAETFGGGGAPGVRGIGGGGPNTNPASAVGVYGQGGTQSPGVVGQAGSKPADGVQGFGSGNFSGVAGFGDSTDDFGTGVYGQGGGKNGPGVRGIAGAAQNKYSPTGTRVGVYGNGATGVVGESLDPYGIGAQGWGLVGVIGHNTLPTGVGVIGSAVPGSQAGVFNGNVQVNGMLSKSGGGFQIDHPEDPANKFLLHSFVESPDMKNIYDGIVVLDALGETEVTLPSWFAALNTEFRYQLTAIGTAGPDLYIAEEISTNSFKIAGGKPNMKVCWQVTGIRHDKWAKANPLPVEQDKLEQELGCYLHPELYGESEQKSIMHARYPEIIQQLQRTVKGNGDA